MSSVQILNAFYCFFIIFNFQVFIFKNFITILHHSLHIQIQILETRSKSFNSFSGCFFTISLSLFHSFFALIRIREGPNVSSVSGLYYVLYFAHILLQDKSGFLVIKYIFNFFLKLRLHWTVTFIQLKRGVKYFISRGVKVNGGKYRMMSSLDS
jgi:hypothetical protein